MPAEKSLQAVHQAWQMNDRLYHKLFGGKGIVSFEIKS